MSVALVIQHAVHMRSVMLSSMLFYIALPGTVLTSVVSVVSVGQLFVDIHGIFVVIFFVTDVGICGNKMPTRCNIGFYCRSYCLLNMFRAPLCPSSGAQEYYTVVAACGISCCGFQVAGLVWS